MLWVKALVSHQMWSPLRIHRIPQTFCLTLEPIIDPSKTTNACSSSCIDLYSQEGELYRTFGPGETGQWWKAQRCCGEWLEIFRCRPECSDSGSAFLLYHLHLKMGLPVSTLISQTSDNYTTGPGESYTLVPESASCICSLSPPAMPLPMCTCACHSNSWAYTIMHTFAHVFSEALEGIKTLCTVSLEFPSIS